MDKSTRAYKMMLTARSSKGGNNSSKIIERGTVPLEFWAEGRNKNWFCNKPLSPVKDGIKTVVADEKEKKIIILENVVVVSKTTNSVAEKDESNQISSERKVEEVIPDESCQYSSLEKPSSAYESANRSDMSSPSDPFSCSGDSSYVPSISEVSSSSLSSSDINIELNGDKDCVYDKTVQEDTLINTAEDVTEEKKIIRNTLYNAATYEVQLPEVLETHNTNIPSTSGFAPDRNKDDEIVVSRANEIIPKLVSNNDQVKEPENNSGTTEKVTGRVLKLKNFCYYCDTDVLNFARHLINNHSMEFDVIKLMSMPAKCLERRRLLALLRNKENYLKTANNCPRRVRRAQIPSYESVLPCDNCLGFFSSKLLYRHRKKCSGKSGRAQSEGQSTLLRHIRIDERLKREVFPRMRADKISMEAKADNLICSFGARYLRIHREKHFATVTSRKMRELSKILIELKKLEPRIKTFFQALQPKYFDLFVQATQIVARYDKKIDVYEAPSFAMNIVNSFKQCCDIAINFVLKGSQHYETIPAAEAEAQLKTMIHLFTANWKYEISSQAANNLHLNKWNKITIVPLANDLKIMKNYLVETAEKAARKLSINCMDASAYNMLVEIVYCQVLLLNRKRPGELQRLLLQTYLNCGNDKGKYEEFESIITPSERVLLKKLKRVVTRGKRGRGVPVLFTEDVQKSIQLIIDIRSNMVPKENLFLFAKANCKSEISGYKIVNKYAHLCGAKNPSSITATRLRKHLATLMQIFNMTDSDIEQLASFMGHTPGVHRGSYRLPDDIYQTAKLSKLLLLMEKGEASEYKGKSLDEIDLNMEENLLGEIKEDESDIENRDETGNDDEKNSIQTDDKIELKRSGRPKKLLEEDKCSEMESGLQNKAKGRVLVPWTNDQKLKTKKFFKEHIKLSKPPKRHECEKLIEENPQIFNNKNWLKIKVFVQNEYKKNTH